MRIYAHWLCCCLCSTVIHAQLPITNVYEANIVDVHANLWTFKSLSLLSGDNVEGYNNQPFYDRNGLLYISAKYPTESHTDIWQLDPSQGIKHKITKSPDSEYSPRIYPADPSLLTVVKVPENDSTIQNLVGYNISSGKLQKSILDHHGLIGYYRFVKEKTWLCFLVDTPHNILAICHEDSKNRNVFASNIGRCFEVLDENNIVFVQKISEEHFYLKEYNLNTGKMKLLAEMPKATEDFVLDAAGHFVCGSQSSILKWDPTLSTWITLIDLNDLGIKKINRMALHGNKLAFVCTKN